MVDNNLTTHDSVSFRAEYLEPKVLVFDPTRTKPSGFILSRTVRSSGFMVYQYATLPRVPGGCSFRVVRMNSNIIRNKTLNVGNYQLTISANDLE